jgi:serine/threonine-protein kinase HipA
LGSFETIAALVYRNRDIEALREFARRLAFNMLIGNGDAHLKNWSLIYRDPRIPTLAPAYDLLASFIYRPQALGAEAMALRFGPSMRFEDMRASAFARLDGKLGTQADLGDIARDMARRVPSEWPQAADVLASHPQMRGQIQQFMQARAIQLVR